MDQSLLGLRLGLACALISISFTAQASPEVVVLGSTAAETKLEPDGSAIHVASSYRFASSLGDMPLRKLTIHRPADVSANYTLRGGGNGDPWVTVIVYPAEQELSAEAAETANAMHDRLAESQATAPFPTPAGARDGRHGWLSGKLDGVDVLSGYYLVRRDRWYLKVRATIPTVGSEAGLNRTRLALEAIDWAGPLISPEGTHTALGSAH